jgi:hypothetical protein
MVTEVLSPLSDQLTPVPDTSNTVTIIREPCLKSPVNVVCVRALLKEKPNGHALQLFQPAVKNQNVQRH